MKFPSKVTPYRRSIFPIVINILNNIDGSISILDLYKNTSEKYVDFSDALCFLYSIGKIKINEEEGIEKC